MAVNENIAALPQSHQLEVMRAVLGESCLGWLTAGVRPHSIRQALSGLVAVYEELERDHERVRVIRLQARRIR